MGIRLPTPSNCPNSVSELMAQCFKEEPKDRPHFSEIKSSVLHSYKLIMDTVNSTKNEDNDCVAEVQYSDFNLENTYLNMKQHNRNFHEGKNVTFDEDQLLNENSTSQENIANESDKMNEPLQYLTPIAKYQTFEPPKDNIDSKSPNSANQKIEYKRGLSSSSDELAIKSFSSLEFLRKLPYSKSLPNPLYMLSLDDIESLHRINELSNKGC